MTENGEIENQFEDLADQCGLSIQALELMIEGNPPFESISDTDWRVMYLRFCNYMTFRSIGEYLGFGTSRARQRFHRGIKRLKGEMTR